VNKIKMSRAELLVETLNSMLGSKSKRIIIQSPALLMEKDKRKVQAFLAITITKNIDSIEGDKIRTISKIKSRINMLESRKYSKN
jgi:hypothetical protein